MQSARPFLESVGIAKYIRGLKRHEYERLVAQGAFEDERVELLEGAIVHMAPHGPLHDGTLDLLVDQFRAIAAEARVRVQSAFAASDGSEPEPDLAIVPLDDYRKEHPRQAYLIAEVADSSLDRDRTIKARVYCQSGVPEYWLVNLVEGKIIVFAGPSGDEYESVSTYRPGDIIGPKAFPQLKVEVGRILG